MRKYASVILPVVLIFGIGFVTYIKIRRHGGPWGTGYINPDMLLIATYILWIAYETAVSRHDFRHEMAVADYGTREWYAASHALTILSVLWCAPVWHRPGIHHIIGAAAFISGISFRIWAIRTLGHYYSHMVRQLKDHRVIDTGPYAFVRHPAYAGMIMAHAGITVFYFNYATLAILLLSLIPSIIARILVEEKTLMGIPGYPEFAKTRKRIIPHIW